MCRPAQRTRLASSASTVLCCNHGRGGLGPSSTRAKSREGVSVEHDANGPFAGRRTRSTRLLDLRLRSSYPEKVPDVMLLVSHRFVSIAPAVLCGHATWASGRSRASAPAVPAAVPTVVHQVGSRHIRPHTSSLSRVVSVAEEWAGPAAATTVVHQDGSRHPGIRAYT